MSNLGELFHQIRISKNWSIREAARKMEISYSHLSVLEKGFDNRTGKDSIPKPETLRIISKTYEYPYEELMNAAGYLNNERIVYKKFDLTLFIGNINLIMGNMTIEEFSQDISDKTGYSINPKQIRSYLNGDIEPFPGTFNILSKYARVTPDFWFMFNTADMLTNEHNKYEENLMKSPDEQFNKDYLYFANIRDDIKSWVLQKESLPYLTAAMEACEKKINPNTLKTLINSIVSERDIKE